MNNNQDNFNINPQMTSTNDQNLIQNNQNGFFQNNAQPINIIPQTSPINNQFNANNNFNQNATQAFNSQIQNNIIKPSDFPIQNTPDNNLNNNFSDNNDSINNNLNNNNININNPNQKSLENYLAEDNINTDNFQNRFINNNIETTNTALDGLNIDGEYNNMPKIDYSQDPQVKQNLEQNTHKKNTITITKEGKVFIMIIVAMLIFIFVMPYIFDLIREIKYR